MATRNSMKNIIREVDSYENYIRNPSKYHVDGVRSFVTSLKNLDKVRLIMEKDARKSIQAHCKYKISASEVSMDPVLALGEWYKGNLSKDRLRKALKEDAKYIDTIIRKYKESRERNEGLKRRERPMIQPKKRLYNIKWTGKIRFTKQMFVSAHVNQAIERGLCK